MKINNKGMTLVELVVSVGLITIVIIFLFRLLVDLRYSDNNTDFDRTDQQTRAIILKNIQEDFLEKKVVALSDDGSNEESLNLKITYADGGSATIHIEEKSFSYTLGSDTEKWELKDSKAHFGIQCVKYSTSLSDEELESDFFYIRITVPVLMNSKSKNHIDDLEFFYLGAKKDIENIENSFPIKVSFLGKNDQNTCG